MISKSSAICFVFSLLIGISTGVKNIAAGEVEDLRERVKQLDVENEELREQLSHLQRRHTQMQFKLLSYLAEHLDGKPINALKADDALRLAHKMAPSFKFNPLVWRVLLETKVLKNEMLLADAEKLLGPATHTSKTTIEWYINPTGRHVAPYLRANVTEFGLSDWNTGNR